MRKVSSLWGAIGAIFVIFMMLIVCYDTIMRYLFSAPTKWGNETTEYLIVGIIFMGAASALVHGRHVRVNLIRAALSRRVQVILDICACLIMAIACALIVWPGVGTTWDAFVRGMTYNAPVNIPVWPFYLMLPVGCLIFGLQALFLIKDYVQTLRSKQVSAEVKPEGSPI